MCPKVRSNDCNEKDRQEHALTKTGQELGLSCLLVGIQNGRQNHSPLEKPTFQALTHENVTLCDKKASADAIKVRVWDGETAGFSSWAPCSYREARKLEWERGHVTRAAETGEKRWLEEAALLALTMGWARPEGCWAAASSWRGQGDGLLPSESAERLCWHLDFSTSDVQN